MLLLMLIIGADPYVYLKCEEETARSETISNSTNPEWKFQAIFFRKKRQDPIVIEVGEGIRLLVL